ncbi:MAG: cation transporting ATPase C-terminal domain-containing protein, partial [Clostridia bacterium]|nr:cation transporting ATPase C-terminal domain-containing protein [Clostridia bacterium]
WSCAISLLLVAMVLFVPPLRTVFQLVQLPWWMYLTGLGLAFVPTVVMEILKAVGFIKAHK